MTVIKYIVFFVLLLVFFTEGYSQKKDVKMDLEQIVDSVHAIKKRIKFDSLKKNDCAITLTKLKEYDTHVFNMNSFLVSKKRVIELYEIRVLIAEINVKLIELNSFYSLTESLNQYQSPPSFGSVKIINCNNSNIVLDDILSDIDSSKGPTDRLKIKGRIIEYEIQQDCMNRNEFHKMIGKTSEMLQYQNTLLQYQLKVESRMARIELAQELRLECDKLLQKIITHSYYKQKKVQKLFK